MAPLALVHELVAHALAMSVALVPAVLSLRVASAQSYVMVSGQVSCTRA